MPKRVEQLRRLVRRQRHKVASLNFRKAPFKDIGRVASDDREIPAIKEIFDRVDGRVPLAQHLSGPEGGPIDLFGEMLKTIADSTRGLPDPARIPPDRDELIVVAPPQAARPS